MQLRKFRLRFRRKIRKHKRQASDIGAAYEDSLDRYVVKRISRLWRVKRFILGWVGLIAVVSVASILQSNALSVHYQKLSPTDGGIFREGIIGTFTNANPIYAQNQVDVAVSKLVFAGLFKYDSDGKLVPDLAENYSVDKTEKEYTVKLRKDLRWQDGQPLSSKDVVFTVNMIQSAESKSFLLPSWKGISAVAKDNATVVFKLSNALSAFPHSLTVGIIPEHILASTTPSQLRSSSFNNQYPVGAGPFKLQTAELDNVNDTVESRIVLESNPSYVSGKPKLERFVIRAFSNESALIDAFKSNDVDAMSGLDGSTPDDLKQDKVANYRVSLSSEVMVFFKNSQTILKDVSVRKALVLGIDKTEALASLKYPVLPVAGPFVSQQVGYDKAFAQPTNKKTEAGKILDDAGWKKTEPNGIRSKDGKQLKFKLLSSSDPEFVPLTSNLQKQWRDLGVEVEVESEPDQDIKSNITNHNYDSLLYGISVGADPDVYVYWHGSQGDIRSQTRLNLSEYKSKEADKALEAGRTRSDEANRAIKYKPFLKAWQNDYPALALYQRQYLYVASPSLSGFNNTFMHSASDRYSNVANWTIRKTAQAIK